MTKKDCCYNTRLAHAICDLVATRPDIHFHIDLPTQLDARLFRELLVDGLIAGLRGGQAEVGRPRIIPGSKWRVSVTPKTQDLVI